MANIGGGGYLFSLMNRHPFSVRVLLIYNNYSCLKKSYLPYLKTSEELSESPLQGKR